MKNVINHNSIINNDNIINYNLEIENKYIEKNN